MAGAPQKQLESYLVGPPSKTVSLTDYLTSPAKAFLTHVCEAHDAFEHCRKKFTKKIDGSYNTDSADSLHHIGLSLVATTMGHFETYQKGMFAGIFERTRYFERFDIKKAVKALEDPAIDLTRFAAYRGQAAPVGLSVADSLSGWHSPATVNTRFRALGIRQNIFSNTDVEELELLWQLRHSIVHTGAFLTLPDSQKISRLHGLGDRAIAFDHSFVNALSRRFHKIVKATNARLRQDSMGLLAASTDQAAKDDFEEFFTVSSPKTVWLGG